MNKHYLQSFNKWSKYLDRLEDFITSGRAHDLNEREAEQDYFHNEIAERCGYCEVFVDDENDNECIHCPLRHKYCGTVLTNSYFQRLQDAWGNAVDLYSSSITDVLDVYYYASEMYKGVVKYKDRFKEV